MSSASCTTFWCVGVAPEAIEPGQAFTCPDCGSTWITKLLWMRQPDVFRDNPGATAMAIVPRNSNKAVQK